MSGTDTGREEVLRRHFQLLTILCFAIMSGVVIFGAVAGYLHYSGLLEPTLSEVPYVREGMVVAGILMVLSVPRLGKGMGPGPSDQSVEAVLGKHKTSVIVTFALSEGVAFLVLVLGLLSGEMALGLGIAGLAVLGMALRWPMRTKLEETLRRIQD